MKKILYIHHSAGWGGAPKCLINLITNLDTTKYRIEVLLLKNSIVADKLSEKGISYKIAESKFYRKHYQFFAHSEAGYIKWYQIFSFIKLTCFWILSRYFYAKKELSNFDFDIVHLNSSVLTDWIAPAKKMGKVIIHIREPFRMGKLDFLRPFFKYIISRYADQIIAISHDNADRINIPFKTEVIYDFCEEYKKESNEKSYGSKSVLYLGGSSTSKGFYTIVKALDYLDKDIKVLFGGHYASKTQHYNIKSTIKSIFSKERIRNRAIQKIKTHPNAVYIGLIHNVQDYINEVCCLISPFVVPHFSCPVIEAHLQKKPAIGSDVKGMHEIISHETNGLIVPKKNPKKLAEAINILATNANTVKIYGNNGYKIAIKKFTKINIKQFEKIYDCL